MQSTLSKVECVQENYAKNTRNLQEDKLTHSESISNF